MKMLKKTLKWLTIIAITFFLYKEARAMAVEFRGSMTYGGELCVFALPLLCAGVKSIIKDIKQGLFEA